MRDGSRTPDDGFSLIELLIATAILVAVTASIFALLNPARAMFAAQPEAMDMEQRLRVGVDTLARDLMRAGAGTSYGTGGRPSGYEGVPILPYRTGATNPDRVGDFFPDRVTVLYAPPMAARSRAAAPVNRSSIVSVPLRETSECPPADPACRFIEGMTVLMTGAAGGWDTFTVLGSRGPVLDLQHEGGEPCNGYEAGALVTQVAAYTYWLKAGEGSDTPQLMRYDNRGSDFPVVDNVVDLTFQYFARPAPEDGAETTRLSAAQLTDGPWRPDEMSPGRYDVDLLRVSRVRVALRVQAAAQFRGRPGPLFRRGGTSLGSQRYLPDREIAFDVSPRNLGHGAGR